MISTTPVGNTYMFSGAAFDCLYSRPVSLLARWSRPLSVLLNAGLCECLWCDLALLLFVGEMFGKLPKDNPSSTRVSMLLGTMDSFLYRERSGPLLDRYLAHFFGQDYAVLQPRPANGCFPTVDVWHDPAIPSSVLLAIPISSQCLDANEETDPRATRSLGCWSLHLCQTNQIWV